MTVETRAPHGGKPTTETAYSGFRSSLIEMVPRLPRSTEEPSRTPIP